MKKQLFLGMVLAGALVTTASASLYSNYTYTGTLANTIIADGNPVGMANTVNVSNMRGVLTDITVTLDVSSSTGNPVSDLYAYLSYNGNVVVLLNRIGVTSGTPFGNTGSGLTVTLSDTGANNIHGLTGSPTGSYQVDNNQAVAPFAPAGSFTGTSGGSLDTTFAGNPNGNWTLFFADVVNGGGNTTLNSWSLDISAVPEPVSLALGVFVAMLLALAGVRWAWAGKN